MEINNHNHPQLTPQELSCLIAAQINNACGETVAKQYKIIAATLAGFEIRLANGQMFLVETREI